MQPNQGINITASNLSHQITLQSGEALTLLDNISLSVKSGEQVAITGASGSGKSSLLTLLAGLERKQQGHISYIQDGYSINVHTLRQKTGFVFQQFHLLPELDALSNVALPLTLRACKDAQTKARSWLERVGLAHRLHQPINKLSGGEQQRVAIARALVIEPSLIFADEPTGNLDEQTAHDIASLIRECAKQANATLLLVTHNLSLAAQLDKQYQLEKGTLSLC